MLMNFHDLIKKYQINDINGVIHVGAHYGQEYEIYRNIGIERMLFFEPVKEIYDVLYKNIGKASGVVCYNYACGNYNGKSIINISNNNDGQSSSILKPKKHIDQYPEITFTRQEEINVVKLDDVGFTHYNYNFINIDVQGYELETLKGASKLLKYIKYIYIEVNNDELYENCALVDDIDKYLKKYKFKRVETDWGGRTWGDALYIKDDNQEYIKKYIDNNNNEDNIINKKIKRKRKQKSNDVLSVEVVDIVNVNDNKKVEYIYENKVIQTYDNNIVNVPDIFQPYPQINYPKDNNELFEIYFHKKLQQQDNYNSNISYLPIYWTSYYINSKFGEDSERIKILQDYIDRLDKKKKYYTIIQYDDGIINDVSKLNLKIFTMGNIKNVSNKNEIPIPLICKNHYDVVPNNEKNILASYIGRNTHKIRLMLMEKLINNKHFVLCNNSNDFEMFKDIMSRSLFSLCPRGYGITSFRICEALEVGSIPVYISDKFILPFNEKFKYGIICNYKDIDKLPDILYNMKLKDIIELRENGKNAYQDMFTYDGCFNKVINKLK